MPVNDLEQWFATLQNTLETAYCLHEEPWKQSGMSGPLERWNTLRKPVADCMDQDGTFLDIGCANGYLLECCIAWAAARGVAIEPYGIDLSARLISLAQERLPLYGEHFWVANALVWKPPRRFTYVRTELVYVPAEYERPYIQHLLDYAVEPGGRLLIANYAEDHHDPTRGILLGSHPTRDLLERLRELAIPVLGYRDGVDPIKGRKTRVAIAASLA